MERNMWSRNTISTALITDILDPCSVVLIFRYLKGEINQLMSHNIRINTVLIFDVLANILLI